MFPNDLYTKPTTPLFWVVISLCKHCFIFTVTSDTPTITALLSSHQTPPFVLGTQVHYFKVHLPTTTTTPPPPPSCLLLPLNSFCFAVISGLFNRKTFSLLSDMLKMLTPIQCSLMQLAASFLNCKWKIYHLRTLIATFTTLWSICRWSAVFQRLPAWKQISVCRWGMFVHACEGLLLCWGDESLISPPYHSQTCSALWVIERLLPGSTVTLAYTYKQTFAHKLSHTQIYLPCDIDGIE